MKDNSEVYFNSFEQIGQSNNINITSSNVFNQNSNTNFQGEKIKLIFSIKNSKIGNKYSLQAKLYDNQAIDYNSEEQVNYFGEDFTFNNFLICNFLPEKKQDLIITLFKNNQPKIIKATLKYIINSQDNTANFTIIGNEYLTIKAENMGKLDDVLNIKFCLKNEQKQNYFVNNKIKFVISNKNNKLFSSSPILDNGTFESTNIPLYLLKPSYNACFYDSNDRLLGIYLKTIDGMQYKDENSRFEFTMPDGDKIDLYDYSEITKNFSFIDYKNAGVKIALSIGIDFTIKNGHYADEDSLHYIKPNELNDYEKAISTCGKIVGSFDYDQIFPVYGFGAIINSSKNKKTSDCFNLNFEKNPDISGIDNVLKLYRDCINQEKLQFSCKAKFAPLLKTVISKIQKDIFEYHILMILTTGLIDDFQETIDILVEASTLPLSVIIIGIGKGDFTKMIELDGDEKPLKSSTGKVRKRDLVQFVPFEKYQNDKNLLFMEVLAEIPRQIIEYYQFKNLNPDKIKKLISKDASINSNLSNITNSSHQNQQMSINTNSLVDNMASINISQTINSQDNAQSIIGNNQYGPNPFANNGNDIYNNSYLESEIPYAYSESNITNHFPVSVALPNIIHQNQIYNSNMNQPNSNVIPHNNYSNSFVIPGVNHFNTNYNIHITNNNITTSNITNNNNNISNSNITNNNQSENMSSNFEDFDFDKLPTQKTIYIPKK